MISPCMLIRPLQKMESLPALKRYVDHTSQNLEWGEFNASDGNMWGEVVASRGSGIMS